MEAISVSRHQKGSYVHTREYRIQRDIHTFAQRRHKRACTNKEIERGGGKEKERERIVKLKRYVDS